MDASLLKGYKPPTKRQWELIRDMQDYGIYKFEGKTMKEASAYITNNMKTFKEQKQFLG